jgi:hypothetical protein
LSKREQGEGEERAEESHVAYDTARAKGQPARNAR